MKLSLRWLQRHVDLSGIEPRQILADLTMSTAEIDGITRFGEGLECVVVGHVLRRDKHPGADRLSVCAVEFGDGVPVQIVCGAPNVATGQKVAVVRPGSTLPAVPASPATTARPATPIAATKIRGVESFGMICSEQELGLSADHDGILVLPPDAPAGARLVDVLPIQDHVFEIDNKSINHRPDLWGHRGFARELAAIYGRTLSPAPASVPLPAAGRQVQVHIDDHKGCPRYCGLVLDGVVAGKSPPELRYLLAAVGQRAINLPVDVTNFVMLDLGQPMHAFDLERIGARSVHVRFARGGERMTTLDGVERELAGSDLLICADDEPVALAGIMGGAGTMVGADTKALFLESANFHAATIRRSSMRLGLRSDASARFEKAQDPANAELAVHHFVRLLQRWCPSATVAGPLSDPAGNRVEPKTVALRRARLRGKLGVALDDARVAAILGALEFGVRVTAEGWEVVVPSFRATKDISGEDDLIEEVGRMFRYDNIPEVPLRSAVVPPARDEELFLVRRLLEVAAGDLATSEVYNYSFVPDAVLQAATGHATAAPYLRVQNPTAPDTTRIRRHVLPSLLASARGNLREFATIRLMEHGKGYHGEVRDQHGLPGEVRELGFVFATRQGPHPYPELREAIARLLRRVGCPVELARAWAGSDQPWVHPHRSVAIERGGVEVGYVAHLHPAVAAAMDLPTTTAIACIDVRALLRGGSVATKFEPLPVYPRLPVDVALLVDAATQVGAVAAFLQRIEPQLVRQVQLFEVYRGERLPPGKKSLNFTVTLGAHDRTLQDADEARYLGLVRERVAEIGGELRG